ncbi:MAG: hypothetical protein MUE78_02380 [Ilumatobacteraceae bacterium]|nr:hypothetical protein [Ilumatobacteraceae bacterium]
MRGELTAVSIGPGIIVPLLVLLIVVPLVLMYARRRMKDLEGGIEPAPIPGARLTSNALHAARLPGWRTVLEIAPGQLGDLDQVVIGPPGVLAVRTSMSPMPEPSPVDPADAATTAAAAVARGPLDDVLRPYRLESLALVTVHWDRPAERPASVDTAYGAVAVDGHQLAAWLARHEGADLSPAQIDLAWQAVTRAVGRPDPLA